VISELFITLCQKRWEIWLGLLLVTNRKSYMAFQMSLNDRCFIVFQSSVCRAHSVNANEGRPYCHWQKDSLRSLDFSSIYIVWWCQWTWHSHWQLGHCGSHPHPRAADRGTFLWMVKRVKPDKHDTRNKQFLGEGHGRTYLGWQSA